jgi:hypothetical protein
MGDPFFPLGFSIAHCAGQFPMTIFNVGRKVIWAIFKIKCSSLNHRLAGITDQSVIFHSALGAGWRYDPLGNTP